MYVRLSAPARVKTIQARKSKELVKARYKRIHYIVFFYDALNTKLVFSLGTLTQDVLLAIWQFVFKYSFRIDKKYVYIVQIYNLK